MGQETQQNIRMPQAPQRGNSLPCIGQARTMCLWIPCELNYLDSYSYVHSVKSDSLILKLHIAISFGNTIFGQRVMRLLSELIIYS